MISIAPRSSSLELRLEEGDLAALLGDSVLRFPVGVAVPVSMVSP